MKIRDILAHKGSAVVTVGPDATVLNAVRTLVEHNIGSVVVVQGDQILGILTERDVLRLAARNDRSPETLTVAEIMTSRLVVAIPDDDVDYVAGIMTQNRIRHLPVVRDGELCGILSIGDVVNSIRGQVEVENRYLKEYIQGAY